MLSWRYKVFDAEMSMDYYNRIYSELSAERRRKADSAGSDERRVEEIMGGYLLESIIHEEISEQDLRYVYSSRGKPYLEGEDIYISLSHTRGVVAAAVSDSPVGIDVELTGRYRTLVAKRYFTEAENALINSLSDTDGAEKSAADMIFTLAWTAKEAVAKCVDMPLADICRNTDVSLMLSGAIRTFNSRDYAKGHDEAEGTYCLTISPASISLDTCDYTIQEIEICSNIYDGFAISVARITG